MEENHPTAGICRQFVLDIGTRSVFGLAGYRQGDVFVVEAWSSRPHPRRAMIDGQIEDIQQVALVAKTVKEDIEQQVGTTFTSVSVAAAGRALKTSRAALSQDLSGEAITSQTAYSLENAAVNEARLQLDEGDETPYYCVGYSVVQYLLDGYPFQNALGHKAVKAEVEVIATFLPAEVVDSLHRCMDLLELEIETMTLEPIAAMRAVIPQDLRLLNLALVDIGAGTSDIAISRDNSVAGYTMATVAGDEVTESLIHHYLVDFDTAEQLKTGLDTEQSLSFTDILGFEHQLTGDDVRAAMEPSIDNLAATVAEKVLDCNAGHPPAAVFLVGGGSKTPGLAAKLAEALGLPGNKVALAGHNFSGRLLNKEAGLNGPEFATPVGIALVAADNANVETATVTINGSKVRLFTADSASIMDALLIGGYRYSDLMGRNGRSLTFALNGVRTVLRGTPYTTATITRNGKPASLSSKVENGDAIEIEKAQNGVDASATIASYAPGEAGIQVTLNEKPFLAGLIARINGELVAPDAPIQEQDSVELFVVKTVGQLCQAADVPTKGAKLTVNGQPADEDCPLQDSDAIVCTAAENAPSCPVEPQTSEAPAAEVLTDRTPTPPTPLSWDSLPQPDASQLAPPPASAATEPADSSPPIAAAPAGSSLSILLNGKNVVLPPKAKGECYRLFDMLTLVDIDPAHPEGTVRVQVNGQPASYLHEIASGDELEIGWKKQAPPSNF